MPVIERSIVINAPVEKIFKIEDDPRRLPEYLPGIVEVTDYDRTPDRIGERSRYVYKAMGMRFEGRATLKEREENKRLVSALEGGIEGTQTNTYEPEGDATEGDATEGDATGDATKVTWRLEYTMKGGILGSIINKLFVEGQNEKNAERGLENLKGLCESS